MKWTGMMLALVALLAFNLPAAMAEDDEHGDRHEYKHESKHEHERDGEREHEREREGKKMRAPAGDRAQSAPAPQAAGQPAQGARQGGHGGVGVNVDFSKWWPF